MTLRSEVLPEHRRPRLRRLLAGDAHVRAIEAHSGLSALAASAATSHLRPDARFDALWLSSLTGSASAGLPDCELTGLDRRLDTIAEVIHATDRPLIVDGDTGGDPVGFEYLCRRLEVLGASAIVIEDKRHPKVNSLAYDAPQDLEDPAVFAGKIKRGLDARLSADFLIFARIESFIAGHSLDDALLRAQTYLESGVDGVMIHSRIKEPREVFEFLDAYDMLCRGIGQRKPVICVPTSYNAVSDAELFERGANVVIHANHLLRASYQAMQAVCTQILESGRSLDAERLCSSVGEIFDAVGFSDAMRRDSESAEANGALR